MNAKKLLASLALTATGLTGIAQASDLLDPNLPVYAKTSGVQVTSPVSAQTL